jgi:hypothetical protein
MYVNIKLSFHTSAFYFSDAEVTTLEAKLSKVREVKAGMMSVLLSGKIRLV